MPNYPTKLHEILGVEPGEKFAIALLNGQYVVNAEGELIKLGGEFSEADGHAYRRALNYGIFKTQKLTFEQSAKLEALYEIGMRWLVRTCNIHATPDKPIKGTGFYHWNGPSIDVCKFTDCLNTLCYTNPINIYQLLKDNDSSFNKEPE